MRTPLRDLLRYNPLSQHLISFHPQIPTSKIQHFHQNRPSSFSFPPDSSIVSSNSSPLWPNSMNYLVRLFSKSDSDNELVRQVSVLKDELLKLKDDTEMVYKILSDSGSPLFRFFVDGSAMVELLNQIYNFPLLAIEVFKWRRKHADFAFPISPEEYAKGIKAAGKIKDVDFAIELFTEAANNRCKVPSTYNALMSVYMMNGLAEQCQGLFREFKKERHSSPNIVTYNILISVFGRLMLIEHMEATLQEIYDSSLIPNVHTFNSLIVGYITAWMWDRMEKTYLVMEETSVGPDTLTFKLMVRGYAHAGNIQKMEEMYAMLKQRSNEDNIVLMKSMISAYCKSSCAIKIEKIDTLLRLVPEREYKSSLCVLLIKLYAREKLLDRMEAMINFALENKVVVTSEDMMRAVSAAYFHHNESDKLSSFVKRAECAGWRLCRSLYHGKMIMYGFERRREEMENVLEEMEKVNINSRVKKTLAILCQAYSTWGQKRKLEQVVALMWKLGYDIHWEKLPL